MKIGNCVILRIYVINYFVLVVGGGPAILAISSDVEKALSSLNLTHPTRSAIRCFELNYVHE